MKNIKLLLAGVCFLGFWFSSTPATYAQDPQFSQYYANKLWLSPAFTGTGVGPRFITGFRSQWAGIPGAFRSMNVSFDTPIHFGDVQNGIGINILADQAGEGALSLIEPTLNYSFLLELGDQSAISLGLSAGIRYNSINFYALRFPDQLLPGAAPGQVSQEFAAGRFSSMDNNNRLHEEVGAGFVYYNPYFFVGATTRHITQPQQRLLNDPINTFDGDVFVDPSLPLYIGGFVGGNIPLDPKGEGTIALMPTVLYRQQGPFQQIDAGMYFKYDPLIFGLYYRTLGNDALIFIVGVEHNNFRFGYSYDYTMSDITNRISGGSHEVSISYEFETVRKKRKAKPKMSCPTF